MFEIDWPWFAAGAAAVVIVHAIAALVRRGRG